MATFTVTTVNDISDAGDSLLSLREAVAQANATAAADTIVFAGELEGQTLVLTGGELALGRDTTIDGDHDNDGTRVAISGDDNTRIMSISGGETDVTLKDIDLRHGNSFGQGSGDGGAVHAGGQSLTVVNATFSDNATFGTEFTGGGGAIFLASGELTVSDSRFIDNDAAFGGALGAYADRSMRVQNSAFSGNSAGLGGAIAANGYLSVEDTTISGNSAGYYHSGGGGGIWVEGTGIINRSAIIDNQAQYGGGGVESRGTSLTISDSTIAGNLAYGGSYGSGDGGGIAAYSGDLVIRNSTITSNIATQGYEAGGRGGGISVSIYSASATLDIANTIVAGNQVVGAEASDADIEGAITRSNGHNIFGSTVTGAGVGDRQLVDPATVFAATDPATGGGMVNDDGIVQLLGDVANPALGGADRFASSSTDQLGVHRPTPSLTNPDIGAAESGFVPSHASSLNNDSIIGNGRANTLNGLAGDDFLKGLAGKDTLNGGDGNDFLEGNGGKDCLNGGAGIDIANYGDSNKSVRVDLRGDAPGDTDTAKRGDGNDTLTGIEGAIGGGGRDRFWGDSGDNWFQGGKGKDTFTGGDGQDLYDYNLTTASRPGSGRDVITDFHHLTDKIDLSGIDADTTTAGDQAFHWVGSAALTGPGELGFFTSGGNTIILASTDGDRGAEFQIQLNGVPGVSALDFYL